MGGGITQAYATVYKTGTVDIAALNVGDTIYKGIQLKSDKTNVNVTRCETCHQLWFVWSADSKSVALGNTAEHSGHNVGWSSFSWYNTNDNGFTANTPYTIMENVYNTTGYTITYNTNGGNAISSISNATKLPNPLPTPQKNGYDFVGWYTNTGLTIPATPGVALTGNITLYAKWNLHSHSFAKVWSKNDEYHWHEATCGHSTKGSYGGHVYGTTGYTRYVCTTCNYTNTARQANVAAADNVTNLIDAIGKIEYTDASKAKIDAARDAYDKLTDDQKGFVNNESTLTAAETEYARLEAAAEKDVADTAAAAAAVAKINAIGKVEYTDESKAKIDEARAAYDALTDDQKAKVTADQLKVLTDAAAEYARLEAAAEKDVADTAAAAAAVAKINAIGKVEYTDESKAKIDEARAAYDALTDDQKAKVTADQLKVLTDAETEYARLEAAAEKDAADTAAAAAAVAKINAIGKVEYTDESKAKIDEARAAYDALTDDQKAKVTADQLKVLTDAETAYADLKAAADQEAANAVIALIDAIGNVEYTDASKAKIDAARDAYDKLTEDQKSLVNNYSTLTEAEKRYEELANTRPGHYKPTQKPEIIAGEGSKADLTLNGTKATITVEEGYEITDVLVNGVSLGKVTEVTGLKTGDKVEIKTAAVFNIESYVKDLKLVARSSKTANKNVRVKVDSVTDQNGNPVDLSELKDKGYTVKYKFYRSEKKSSEYGERLEKDIDNNSYLNNIGDKGTKYFYRVKVMVYDANGKLAAQTELNQCRYAVRTWSK